MVGELAYCVNVETLASFNLQEAAFFHPLSLALRLVPAILGTLAADETLAETEPKDGGTALKTLV